MTGMLATSHTLFVVLNSRGAHLKEENECDIFVRLSPTVFSGGLGALILSLPLSVQPLQPPLPDLKKNEEKFKAFLSAGICLCTPNVQSMTLSLIIHVTTS